MRDLANQVFGKLVAIRPDGKNSNGQYFWISKCECGAEHRCLGTSLISGQTTRCKQCTKRRWLDQNYLRATSVGDLTSAWWSARVVKRAHGYNSKAKQKIYELEIDMKQAWDLFEQQQHRCALSGLPISFPKDRDQYGGTASLDRIDSKKGYVLGNVQWVHKDINSMKNAFDQAYFVELCKAVTSKV